MPQYGNGTKQLQSTHRYSSLFELIRIKPGLHLRTSAPLAKNFASENPLFFRGVGRRVKCHRNHIDLPSTKNIPFVFSSPEEPSVFPRKISRNFEWLRTNWKRSAGGSNNSLEQPSQIVFTRMLRTCNVCEHEKQNLQEHNFDLIYQQAH